MRRVGEAGLIPELAEDQAVREDDSALKSAGAAAKGHCRGAHGVVELRPILLYSRGREYEVIAKYPDRTLGIMHLEPSGSNPPRRDGRARQIQDMRLGKVHQAIGCATILSQHGLKFGNISTRQANGQVVRIDTNNEKTPLKSHSLKADPKGGQQGLYSEVKKERGKGVALAYPACHKNRR
jgi:hypothetical protein